MTVSTHQSYRPYLLATLALMAAATLVFPHDTGIFQTLQSVSKKAGKFHLIREILELFRPFGQGDVILMIAVGMGLCGARRRALHIMIALAVMSLLIWPIKIGVGRERPAFRNAQSFPSGDAATAAAFATPFAGLSPWMASAGVLMTGGVAAERIFYGRHYASDVLTGAALGVLSGAMALAILRRWRWRPSRRLYAILGVLILAPSLVALFCPRGPPYLITVLRTWGPFGLFLILTRLAPVWTRKRRTAAPHPPCLSAAGRTGLWLMIVSGAAGGGVLMVAPLFYPLFGLRISFFVIGLIILSMAHALWSLDRRKRHEAISTTIISGIACLILALGFSLLPAIYAFRASILTF